MIAATRSERAQVALLCAVAFAYMECCELTRWMAGKWYLADVGNIHYCMVNTLRGRFMYSPLMESNHFAYHFTPLLVLLSPITLLSKYPIPLVTIYVLALALCPAAVYKLARKHAAQHWPAQGIAVLFLGNHFVGSLQLANHFEVFFVLFAMCCMAARTGSRWFWIFAVLTLSIKEDAAVWLGGYAVFGWLITQKRDADTAKYYVRLTVLCTAWLAAAGAIMFLTGKAAGAGALAYAQRAGGIRFGTDSLVMLFVLLASFGFLPLLAGWAVVLVLLPAPILLLQFPFMRNLLYYYSYPFLPYLVLASAMGLGQFLTWMQRARPGDQRGGMVVAALLVLCGAIQFALPTRTDGYKRLPAAVTSRDNYRIETISSMLPQEASVVIQFGLWGITPTCKDARMLTKYNITSDSYAILDLQSPHGMERDEFISLAQSLTAAVEEKRRPMLHSRGEIYIVGPVVKETAR